MNITSFDIWKFAAGLGLFLLGMFFLELALKNLAGKGFKRFLKEQTTNPIKGVLGGTMITALLQSSSVVSLMVLAFVGAGILQLKNAIGIVFGSNLGTTFTGWIVASLGFKLDIVSFASPMIAIGGLLFVLFKNNEKLQDTSRAILGFGFLFLGLEYMKLSVGDLSNQVDLSQMKGAGIYLFFMVGLVLTAIVQSSSVTMVITLSALYAEIIALDMAAAIVVGSNLGTTITVMLGAIKGTPAKKRVAASHFLFNLVTVVFALLFLYPILHVVNDFLNVNDPLMKLVVFNSSFNLIGIIIMLPFVSLFAKFLEKRFVEDEQGEAHFLQKVPATVPEAAIQALKNEMLSLVERVFYFNLISTRVDLSAFRFPDYLKKTSRGYFSAQSYLDRYAAIKQLEGEIIAYYLKVQKEKLEDEVSQDLNRYIHAVRNALSSAKELKDVHSDLVEFERSSNEDKERLYMSLKIEYSSLFLSLYNLFLSEQEAAHFEQLSDLLNENKEIYERSTKEIFNLIEQHRLSEIEVSTLLNAIRALHNSNRGLILSMKDLKLNSEEADSFNDLRAL